MSRHKTVSTSGLTRRAALGGAAVFAATLPTIRSARAAVELRLTHPADLSHPVHLEAEAMVKRISERSNGEVKITIFPNNALGSPVEAAQQTRLGAIDMMLLNPANIEALSKTIGVINIPYQFDSYEHAHKTLDVTGRDWIAEQLKTAGFAWIANFEWGFRATTNSRRAINQPADVQGLKIRVPPELAIKAAFEALGASTQTIAFQEVYLALANKVVDGQDNPVAVIETAKFAEVQKYLSLTRHLYTGMPLLMSKKTWDSLSPEERSVIQSAADEAKAVERKALQTQEVEAIDRLKKSMQVNEVSAAELDRMREKVQPVVAKFASEVGEPLAKQVSDELARLRAN